MPELPEHVYLLDLLLYRPNAFLLLSYIKFQRAEKQLHPLPFSIQGIRGMCGREVLNSSQVRRNLDILCEWGFIQIERPKYPPKVRLITILQRGEAIDG